MLADRADLRCLFADVDVTAVAALPALLADLDENFTLLDIFKQLEIALFMTLFNRGDAFEGAGDRVESLFRRVP